MLRADTVLAGNFSPGPVDYVFSRRTRGPSKYLDPDECLRGYAYV